MKNQKENSIQLRVEQLKDQHMPNNFDISLEAYGGGGTDKFLNQPPKDLVTHSMKGFDTQYKNIVDYIVRITHRIWEEKDIGYIYDTYSHDCRVWDDFGLQSGSEKIVADTVHTNSAFPDIRLLADEVIWAGDEDASFHTSHRTIISGTNTGYSKFSEPTGKSVRLLCIANCVAKENEIYYEHVVYDTAAMIKQLGLNVEEVAKEVANNRDAGPFGPDFRNLETKRMSGQAKPPSFEIPEKITNVREFAHAIFNTIWNRRNFSAIDQVYSDDIVFEGSTGRIYRGKEQLRSFVISMITSFPNLALSVEDIYWMGNEQDGYLVSVRWGAIGAHRGNGSFGPPTGKECYIWGITQWLIENNKIKKEWTAFNEFGILMQLLGDSK